MSLSRLVSLLLAALFAVGGLLAGGASFSALHRMRQLERVPRTTVDAVLPGETNLRGRVLFDGGHLQAPDTKTPCVYYHFTIEEERTDSEGSTSWHTIHTASDRIPFLLEDATGALGVNPAGAAFHVPQSDRRRSGKKRWTEWRVDAGADLFVFGVAAPGEAGALALFFDRPGDYSPIISRSDEASERSGMAAQSLLFCWLALVAASGVVYCLCRAVGIHRLLVYLAAQTVVLAAVLSHFGVDMMHDDLREGSARLRRQVEAAEAVVRRALPEWTGDWAALDDVEDARLRRIRIHLAAAAERMRRQRTGFPERLFAEGWGIGAEPVIPLAPGEEWPESAPARLAGGVAWLVGLLGFALAVLATRFGVTQVRLKRMIEAVTTARPGGVVYGLNEVAGEIALPEGEEALVGPLTGAECVHYHYIEREERGSGKQAHWVTIADQKRQRRFLCRDREGELTVDPAGAEILTRWTERRERGRREYIESRLEVGDQLYALGHARVAESGAALLLGSSQDGPFLLGNLKESDIMHRKARNGLLWLGVAFGALLSAALAFFGSRGAFAATDYLAAALVAPLYMTLFTLAMHYNDLVFLRDLVARNAANIEVALKKRHDLVPRLVAVVKGAMGHEASVQERIAELRAGAPGALVALAEAYPALATHEQGAELMKTLARLENEIAFIREGYNQAVTNYNTRIASFPDLLFARLFGFGPRELIR